MPKKIKLNQITRLVLIAMGLPLVLFLIVAFFTIIDDYIPHSFNYYILWIAPVVTIILASITYDKSTKVKKIIGRRHYQRMKSKSFAVSNAKETSNSDPLMNKIRQNSVRQFDNIVSSSQFQSKSLTIIQKAIYFIFLVIVVLYFSGAIPEMKKIYFDLRISEKKAKKDLVESKARGITSTIDLYKRGAYPKELPKTILNLGFDLEDDYVSTSEKKYFGKKIELSDFEYTSDGYSYELCIKPEFGGKCWRSN